MTDYNGFTPRERQRAQQWLNDGFAAGRLTRPTRCCNCGETAGVIDCHAEDYTWPFGAHLLAFPLCFICHMMVHARFRNPEAWAEFDHRLRAGDIFDPFHTRNWRGFELLFLKGKIIAKYIRGPHRQRLAFETMFKGGPLLLHKINWHDSEGHSTPADS